MDVMKWAMGVNKSVMTANRRRNATPSRWSFSPNQGLFFLTGTHFQPNYPEKHQAFDVER
jgi:hypothetical protein